MNLEPLRTGVVMTWESLEPRERAVVLYVAAWFALAVFSWLAGLSRENLRREILEELADRGDRSHD